MATRNFIGWGSGIAVLLISFSCQKLERPPLGDYPTDTQTLPGGPLRFFVSFNTTNGASARWNAADSVSGNPAQLDPLTTVQGVTGNGVQGVFGQALRYLNANDFASTAKSYTVAMWLKSAVPHPNVNFVFSLAQTDDAYWEKSAMFMYIDHDGAGSRPDSAVVTFAVKDNWYSFGGKDRIPHILDNQWHHLAFVYDETTSRLTTYVDGKALTGLSDAATKNGITGPVNFTASKISNLIIGGANGHAGVPGIGTMSTDPWQESFAGSLDQFRLYNKALTATEVLALYNSKQ